MAHSFAFGAVITGRRLRQLVVSTSTSLRKEPVLQQLCRCATFSAKQPTRNGGLFVLAKYAYLRQLDKKREYAWEYVEKHLLESKPPVQFVDVVDSKLRQKPSNPPPASSGSSTREENVDAQGEEEDDDYAGNDGGGGLGQDDEEEEEYEEEGYDEEDEEEKFGEVGKDKFLNDIFFMDLSEEEKEEFYARYKAQVVGDSRMVAYMKEREATIIKNHIVMKRIGVLEAKERLRPAPRPRTIREKKDRSGTTPPSAVRASVRLAAKKQQPVADRSIPGRKQSASHKVSQRATVVVPHKRAAPKSASYQPSCKRFHQALSTDDVFKPFEPPLSFCLGKVKDAATTVGGADTKSLALSRMGSFLEGSNGSTTFPLLPSDRQVFELEDCFISFSSCKWCDDKSYNFESNVDGAITAVITLLPNDRIPLRTSKAVTQDGTLLKKLYCFVFLQDSLGFRYCGKIKRAQVVEEGTLICGGIEAKQVLKDYLWQARK